MHLRAKKVDFAYVPFKSNQTCQDKSLVCNVSIYIYLCLMSSENNILYVEKIEV